MKKFLHCVELNTGEFAITTVAKLQLTLIIAYVFFRNQLIIIINVVSWLQVWEGSVWYIFRCFGISYIYIKPMLSSTARHKWLRRIVAKIKVTKPKSCISVSRKYLTLSLHLIYRCCNFKFFVPKSINFKLM